MSRPVVYLWNLPIESGLPRAGQPGLVAVAHVSIPWGRESPFDRLDPQAATIRLLDFSDDVDRYGSGGFLGAPVRVRREGNPAPPAGVTLLDGLVTSQDAREVRVRHPRWGVEVTALEITLTVADTAGCLAMITRRGPYPGMTIYGQGGIVTGQVNGPWSPGGWDQQWPADRLASMRSMIARWAPAATIATGPHPAPQIPATRPRHTSLARAACAGIPSSELKDAWTMLVEAYATAEPLGWPRVRPADRIEQGKPELCGDITLATSGGWVVIQSGMPRLSASHLALDDDDVHPGSAFDDVVGEVQVDIHAHKYRWQPELTDTQTNRVIREAELVDDDLSETHTMTAPSRAGSSRTLSTEAALGASQLIPPTPATSKAAADEAWNGALAVGALAAERAERLGGWLRYPPCTYRPTGTTENAQLLQTWDTGPLWVAGSKWAPHEYMPRAVQIIGGTLAYTEDGWEHELHLAPALDPNRTDLTLTQLLDPIDKPFSSWHQDVTIADLCIVNRRTAT